MMDNVYAHRSISLWFKVYDLNHDSPQVIYEEDGIAQGLKIYREDDRLFFNVWHRSTNDWSSSYLATDIVDRNTWHHLALVLDRTQTKPFTAYLDGTNIDWQTQQQSSQANVGVGGLNQVEEGDTQKDDSASGYSIKDIRVYERSLSGSEIDLIIEPNNNPLALEDTFLTVENQEITLFSSALLENDRDPDGDRLSIDAVGRAINGTVALDESQNIVFTPQANFNGEASFEYTLKDDRGGMDRGRVNLTVLAETSPILVGTNLHRLADWSPQLPFLNGFKSARRWLTQDIDVTKNGAGEFVNTWNTQEFDRLDLDENGWVKSLPDPEDEPRYTSVGTILYRDLPYYPAGEYVVLYEGEGTIEYDFDAVKDESASTPGRDIIDVTPTKAGVWLRITETDPNESGDYLRDIDIMPVEYEYADNQIFNPAFLDKIQPFNTLRFMDWMATNNSTQGEWNNRPTPESSVFSGEIASLESMVELANRTHTDPWFTIPHQATDEYVTNFAEYVRDNLDPELQVYVEYSNEVWNRDFDQGWWVEDRGIEEFADSNVGDFGKRIDWYSKRTTEITGIWDEVFDTEKEKVIGVMSGQAANSWTARRALGYYWAEQPRSSAEYGIDAISFAPYFGSYLGSSDYEAEIESWTEDADGGLDKLFEELTVGGVLEDAPQGGSLQQSYSWTENYKELADIHGLDLLIYEAGQHLRGNDGVEDNQAITELFTTANREPRMGEIYQEYFTTLDELGVDLTINYTDVSGYNKWGSWGALEHINQGGSPKYNVLQSLVANNNNNLPPQIGTLNNNLSDLGLIVEGDTLTLEANYTDIGLQDYHEIEFDWGNQNAIDLEQQSPLLGDIGQASSNYIYDRPGNYTVTLTITDDDNLEAQKSLPITVAAKTSIDWKPSSTNPRTNLAGDGQVRVAVLGAENFDPVEIDPNSVRADDDRDTLLNGNGIYAIQDLSSLQDVNSDGFEDLVLVFDKATLRSAVSTDSNFAIDDNQIYLFGTTVQQNSYFFGSAE